jgi:hypothetical protein
MVTSSIGRTTVVQRKCGKDLPKAIRKYKIERKYVGQTPSFTSIADAQDIGGLPDISRS